MGEQAVLVPLAEAICTSKGWIGLYSMPKGRRQEFIDQASDVLRHLGMQGFRVSPLRRGAKLALLDPTTARLPIPWRPVVEEVCRGYDASLGDVMARRRGRVVTRARHAIWHAIQQRFGSSLAEIGRRFGFHHTSVAHGIELHAKRLAGIDGQQY